MLASVLALMLQATPLAQGEPMASDVLLRDGQFGVVRRRLEQHLASHAHDVESFRRLLLIGAGSPSRTVAVARRLGECSAAASDLVLAATACFRVGELHEARALLEGAPVDGAMRAHVLNLRGMLDAAQGKDEEALRNYHLAVESDPFHRGASRAAEHICLKRGEIGAALQFWHRRFWIDACGDLSPLRPLVARSALLCARRDLTAAEVAELADSLHDLGLLEAELATRVTLSAMGSEDPRAQECARYLAFERSIADLIDDFYLSAGDDHARVAFWGDLDQLARQFLTTVTDTVPDECSLAALSDLLMRKHRVLLWLPPGIKGVGGLGADPGAILFFRILLRRNMTTEFGRVAEVVHLGDDIAASRRNRLGVLYGELLTGLRIPQSPVICINHAALLDTSAGNRRHLARGIKGNPSACLRARAMSILGAEGEASASHVARYYAIKCRSTLQHELVHLNEDIASPILQESCAILAEFAGSEASALIACADLLLRAERRDLGAVDALVRLTRHLPEMGTGCGGDLPISDVNAADLARGARKALEEIAALTSPQPK